MNLFLMEHSVELYTGQVFIKRPFIKSWTIHAYWRVADESVVILGNFTPFSILIWQIIMIFKYFFFFQYRNQIHEMPNMFQISGKVKHH
jgi:hypothetical protein